MALRKGHGKGAGVPRVEVLPPDELPAPLPDKAALIPRREDGTVVGQDAAAALGRLGGLAKARKARLLQGLGLRTLPEGHRYKPYEEAALEYMKFEMQELAKVCGGTVGTGPAAMISSAAMLFADSKFLHDIAVDTGDLKTFARAESAANSSRQNRLAAYELANREGKSRKDDFDPLSAFRADDVDPVEDG